MFEKEKSATWNLFGRRLILRKNLLRLSDTGSEISTLIIDKQEQEDNPEQERCVSNTQKHTPVLF